MAVVLIPRDDVNGYDDGAVWAPPPVGSVQSLPEEALFPIETLEGRLPPEAATAGTVSAFSFSSSSGARNGAFEENTEAPLVHWIQFGRRDGVSTEKLDKIGHLVAQLVIRRASE